MLQVTIEELDDTAILHCTGRIVYGDETRILCAALKHRKRNIVLDLSRVEAIDAAGIGALISLQAAGIYLRLWNPPKAIRQALRVTGVDSVFEIFGPEQIESDKEARSDRAARTLLPAPSADVLRAPARSRHTLQGHGKIFQSAEVVELADTPS